MLRALISLACYGWASAALVTTQTSVAWKETKEKQTNQMKTKLNYDKYAWNLRLQLCLNIFEIVFLGSLALQNAFLSYLK